jgi:hypothetical protein
MACSEARDSTEHGAREAGGWARGLRAIGTNLVVLVGSIAVILFLLEIGVRILQPRKHFAATVNVWDRVVGTRQMPGACGFVICPDYSIDLIINSKGLRDRDYPYAKNAGTRRILCLGDSFACGYGVESEETFAKVLEGLLDLDDDRAEVWEVLNGGVGSTGTAHQLAYFETEGHKYNPDFVLLCFCPQNDFWDNVVSGLYSLENGDLVKHDAPQTASRKLQVLVGWIPFYNAFFCKSHLLNLVKGRLARYHYRDLAERFKATESDPGIIEREENLTRALIIALREACRRVDCQLVITMVPPQEGESWDRETADLVEYIKQQDIPFIDLTPAFWEQERRGVRQYHPKDGHWNVTGHQKVAEIVHEFFVNL